MQMIKPILIILAIVVLSVTWFESIAQAAQIITISPPKGLVVIDEGEEAGFTVGSTVCFVSRTGEETICGIITLSSASKATVFVGRPTRWLEKRTEALLYKEEDVVKGKEETKGKREEKDQVKDQDKKIDQVLKKDEERVKKEDWFR